LDHSGLGVLSNEECLRRLRAARVGRVAFVERGEPVILPVNHGLDGDAVVFLTAPGSKLVAADNELPVAFEVDGYDADRRAGWSDRHGRGRSPRQAQPGPLKTAVAWAVASRPTCGDPNAFEAPGRVHPDRPAKRHRPR
jgi:nitroimidazol reductase NimA-like FMN-containing flavoprotein (pyridoxamine 5'-phosphate oxidase superfamily)